VALECHHVSTPARADEILARLPRGSLVVNATGAGKDTPGSPLTDAAVFPSEGIAWEFNYRGKLVFLEQAQAQQSARRLRVVDGWVYFLHGWTRVMSDVFEREIPARGPLFEELGRIAAATR
jgi:shikimate 5-dehydrogenase